MAESQDATVNIKAFHTSKADGGEDFIFKNAPFLSEKGDAKDPKWLTDGYYLWTDSIKFAEIWGKNAIKSDSGYAITECEISLLNSELLDLVGNVSHQEIFEASFKLVSYKLQKKPKDVIVPEVIQYYRDHLPDEFPWVAIKAFDVGDGTKRKMAFRSKRHDNDMPEITYFPTRQQICVFECAKSKISNVCTTIYPKEGRSASGGSSAKGKWPRLKERK